MICTVATVVGVKQIELWPSCHLLVIARDMATYYSSYSAINT